MKGAGRPPARPALSDIRRAVERRKTEILEWTTAFTSFPSENRPPAGAEEKA